MLVFNAVSLLALIPPTSGSVQPPPVAPERAEVKKDADCNIVDGVCKTEMEKDGKVVIPMKPSGKVHEVKFADTPDFFAKHERVYALFYIDNPLSKHYKESLAEIANIVASMNLTVKFMQVDMTHPSEAENAKAVYEFSTFPDMKYYYKGNGSFLSQGNRTFQMIAEHLALRERPPLEEVTEEELEKLRQWDPERPGFYRILTRLKKGSVRHKVVGEVAQMYRDLTLKEIELETGNHFRFYFAPLPSDADPKNTTLALVSRPRGETIDFKANWKYTPKAMFKWIRTESVGLVSPYVSQQHKASFLKKMGYYAVFIGFLSDDSTHKEGIESLTKVAQENQDLRVTHFPLEEKSNHAAFAHWPVSKGGVVVLDNSRKYFWPGYSEWEPFMENVRAGKMQPFYRTQNSTVPIEEDGLRVLTGENHDEVALDEQNDVLVLYYFKGDSHSDRALESFQKVGEMLKHNEKGHRVALGKFNLAENECRDCWDYRQAPLAVLFPASKNSYDRKQRYEETMNADTIYDWIEKEADSMEDLRRTEVTRRAIRELQEENERKKTEL